MRAALTILTVKTVEVNMNPITKMLTKLVGGIQKTVKEGGGIQAVAELIDEYKLTEEEILTEEARYEAELTKRLQADMKSDNWFAKSVRPLGFMIWTVIVLLMIFLDGNLGAFAIKDAYLPLIETVYVSYISFYIGSRGVEKTIRLWKNGDKK